MISTVPLEPPPASHGMPASVSVGKTFPAMAVVPPTIATAPASPALRAHAAPSFGSNLSLQNSTSSGRPSMPPDALIASTRACTAVCTCGTEKFGLSRVAIVMNLIGSPAAAAGSSDDAGVDAAVPASHAVVSAAAELLDAGAASVAAGCRGRGRLGRVVVVAAARGERNATTADMSRRPVVTFIRFPSYVVSYGSAS